MKTFLSSLLIGIAILFITMHTQSAFERIKNFFSRPGYIYDRQFSLNDNNHDFVIKISLPGYKKEQISVSAHPYSLTITGHTVSAESSSIPVRSFKQIIKLPAEIMINKVSARYQEGVVTIIAPKRIYINEAPVAGVPIQ